MSTTEAAVDVKDTALITEPMLKTQKSVTNGNDPDKFKYGVLIRGKFIGVEDVKEDHGDDLCTNSMIKLKAIVLAKKEHKQRICIKVTLDGVEILDEKTNQPIFNHSVNKISYIARDVSDPRAIGYIYKNGKDSFQYFAIKTLGQAQELFNTLKELFEVVLEMRNKQKQQATTGTVTEDANGGKEKGAAASASANDPEISNLKEKIKQMNEQPEPSLLEVGGNEALTSLEDSLPSLTVESKPIEPAKKASAELFDLFDSAPETPAAKPPVDPKYTMLANEISNLNSLSSTPPRSAPMPPQMGGPGFTSPGLVSQNPFPMQAQPGFNMAGMQPMGGYNMPMQMAPNINNPFGMPPQAQYGNPMGAMRMTSPMTAPMQGGFMTPQPQPQPQPQQQQQQFNNSNNNNLLNW